MSHPTLMIVLVTGGLLGLGSFYLIGALIPATPKLSASLDRLAELGGSQPGDAIQLRPDAPRSERMGLWLHAHSPLPLTRNQLNALRLRDSSIPEFFADKAVMAILGAAVPTVIGLASLLFGSQSFTVPGAVAVGCAVLGWFIPDLRLRSGTAAARSDAGEALFTFFDLVTLERLANLSGTQSLHAAASLSDSYLFVQIRGALERARLEQQPPYAELKRLADQFNLPELGDIADVMRLDETGAALSGALRSRVKELRDAHLTNTKIAANVVSERMTVFMVIPAMVFGLIFLAPPMMTLLLG